MSAARIVITLDRELLRMLDEWVRQGRDLSRSSAIEEALREKLMRRAWFAQALGKLDRRFERALADHSFVNETFD